MEDINTVEGIEVKKEYLNPSEESVMEEDPKTISGPKFTLNETYQIKYLEEETDYDSVDLGDIKKEIKLENLDEDYDFVDLGNIKQEIKIENLDENYDFVDLGDIKKEKIENLDEEYHASKDPLSTCLNDFLSS